MLAGAAAECACRKALLFLEELCVCESLSLTDLLIEPKLSAANLAVFEVIVEMFDVGARCNAKAISENSIDCRNQYISDH